MKLEYGKRYVTGDGMVTGSLTFQQQKDYPFVCTQLMCSWHESGSYNIYNGYKSVADLVAEY